MREFENIKLKRLRCRRLYPLTFLVDEDKIWLNSIELSGLFSYDLKTEEVHFECEIPDEDRYRGGLFGEMVKIGDKLVLPPHFAKHIGIYDTKDGGYTALDFDRTNKELPFFLCETYGNEVFFFPFRSLDMLVLNTQNNHIRKLHVPEDLFHAALLYKEVPYFFCYSKCVVGTKVYIPYGDTNQIVVFDFETLEFETYHVLDKKYRIFSICYDGNFFWLGIHDQPVIIRWNMENNDTLVYDNQQFCLEDTENGFHTAVFCNNTAYFWHYSDRLVMIDTSTGEWTMHTLSQGKNDRPRNYCSMRAQGEQVILFTSWENNGYRIDSRTKKITKFCVCLPSEREDDLKRIEFWNNIKTDPIWERERCKLEDYLDLIEHFDLLVRDSDKNEKERDEAGAGKRILDATL